MTQSGDVGIEIAPEVADDPALAARTSVRGDGGRNYGLLQHSHKWGGADFSPKDGDRIRELAAFAGAALDALRAARR